MSDRAAVIAAFLRRAGWGDARRQNLAGDASFRRYERLRRGSDVAVLMDAPPPQEDVRPFVRVDRALRALGLAAPAILAEDAAAGLLLLEDLGDDTYTRVLKAQPEREESLYALATDALIALHKGFRLPAEGYPLFTDDRAVSEAERMLEWAWPAIKGGPPPAAAVESYRAAWRAVLPAWRRVPESLILYDFHVDNLILRPGRQGVAACGLLDFQDGVIGPVGFDLMSLVQDVRRDVPDVLARRMIDRYLAAFPELDREAYLASYAVGGAQRNARILGTFVRLWKRDGKPSYLAWMPRTWRMVETNLAHPALAPLARWFDQHFPPAERTKPLPGAPAIA
jgi:N-acetylmuramate 1-kinase